MDASTLPIWRLMGCQALIPVNYWLDPHIRSVMQRALADPTCLRELSGYPLELEDCPQRHHVHAVPPIAFVSMAFVRAAARAGFDLPFVTPRLRVGSEPIDGYVIPVLRCRTEWLDRARSEFTKPDSVLEDVWLAPPHEEVFVRQPETRILNVTNGIFQALTDAGLIDVQEEAEQCLL